MEGLISGSVDHDKHATTGSKVKINDIKQIHQA
ncbi:MAG: hypothetical protein ACI9MS_001462 [Glaciecola sp.]|jgi:hypothetical protein